MAPIIGPIISGLISWFSNSGPGHKIGTVVAEGAAITTLLPVVWWLIAHKDDAAVTFTFTYGQLAVLGAVLFFVVKIIHYTRAGSARDRDDYRPG